MRKTLGEQLLELKARSGLSLSEIAHVAGFKGPSSIQRYFNAEYDGEGLSVRLAMRLVDVLEGQGDPPIQEAEVWALSELNVINKKKVELPVAPETNAEANTRISVYATVPHTLDFNVADAPVWADGIVLQNDNAVESFNCPTNLGRRDVYGIYASDMSMMPRFEQGDIVFTEGKKPASVGDDVLVILKESIENIPYPVCMLARLQMIEGGMLLLRHFSGQTYPFPIERIASTRRVLRNHELLEP